MDRLRAAPDYIRSIPVDIILTVVLCGLWNIWIQARQMRALNYILGTPKYNFWMWLGLCLITCGLYHIYHEYRMSRDLAFALNTPESQNPVIHLVLSFFGLSLIVDALQQSEINRYFGNHDL